MKKITVCLAVTVFFLQVGKSQDSLNTKESGAPKPGQMIRIYLPQGQNFTAHLMDIKDSSVFVFQKSKAPDPLHKSKRLMELDSNWDKYNYRFITSIKVRNKTLRTWTILTGLVAGAIAGVAIAKPGGTGYTGETTNAFGEALGFVLGAGVGIATGVIISSAVEKKYLINGDWKSFEELKAALKY